MTNDPCGPITFKLSLCFSLSSSLVFRFCHLLYLFPVPELGYSLHSPLLLPLLSSQSRSHRSHSALMFGTHSRLVPGEWHTILVRIKLFINDCSAIELQGKFEEDRVNATLSEVESATARNQDNRGVNGRI